MLSHIVSLRRLRFYERECRRGSAAAGDALTKYELGKFEESFRRAAIEARHYAFATAYPLAFCEGRQTASPPAFDSD